MMNSKRLEILQYSALVPEEEVVKAIQGNIKGAVFLKSTVNVDY